MAVSVDEGLVSAAGLQAVHIRIHNTNTKKVIAVRFAVSEGEALVDGDFVVDGVSGTGAAIRLQFDEPGGAKTGALLPAHDSRTTLEIPGFGRIEASIVDAATPCVFVGATAPGRTGNENVDELEADEQLMRLLDCIRMAASAAVGLAPIASAAGSRPSPVRVAMVAKPQAFTAISGTRFAALDADLAIRMKSDGKLHRAVPLTGALCLGVASRIPGSIPHALILSSEGPIRIAHPSGITQVDADLDLTGCSAKAHSATVYRTARRLFEGYVYCRTSATSNWS